MKNKGWKTFLILDFLKTLVTQNHNSAFNKGFYLKQAVNCSLSLLEKSYDQKYIFVTDFKDNLTPNFPPESFPSLVYQPFKQNSFQNTYPELKSC